MKVLQLSLFFLKCLGICSNVHEPQNDFLRSINSIFTLGGFLGPMITLSAVFAYYNSSDILLVTQALIILTAGISGFGAFLSLGIHMKSIKALYTEIQTIVDLAKQTPAFIFYVNAECTGNLYLKWVVIIGLWAPGCSLLCISVGYAGYNMWMGNWDTTTYFLPQPISAPFLNNGTVIEFFVQLLIQSYGGLIYGTTVIAVVMYFVSCCMFIDACCQDFRRIFDEINELAKADGCAKNLLEMKSRFRQATTLHIKIMEWVSYKHSAQHKWI